jgi:Transposase DDE domain.
MDSQLAQTATIKAVRSVDADYLINVGNQGAVSDHLDEPTDGEPTKNLNTPYGDLKHDRRPNAFASPVPSEEVGSETQGRGHTVFLTNLDIEERDVQGLAFQYRARWRIETAIRELKNRFHARTKAKDGEVRTWFFETATLFYNLHAYIKHTLPARLGPLGEEGDLPDEAGQLTGEEFLHILRDEIIGELSKPGE